MMHIVICLGAALAAAIAMVAGELPHPERASTTISSAGHLGIAGTRFVGADGTTFQWRGITAFRLADHVADGNEAEARRYLAWARSQGLTVVRVFAMLDGFFDLSPDAGRRALPALLRRAAEHHLHVEVVGLTNTAKGNVDPREQIRVVGEIVARHPNGLVEVGNEPKHPTQSAEVHRPEFLRELAATIPEAVPVALGSMEDDDGFAAGEYVTWHSPRASGKGGWDHVLEIASGADLVRRFRKPVIGDEPIGAGPSFEPGRRDNSPERFRAAALLTRLTGLGATFHYESGLHARIPTGGELECFNAWNEAWRLLPGDIEHRGVFRKAGDEGSAVRAFNARDALGVFERQDGARAWVLVIRPAATPALQWAPGWSVLSTRRLAGVHIIEARK